MRNLITTVTLNASIDKTCYVPAWSKGRVTRATESIVTAGGKGLNVARVLKQLGQMNVVATGFVGGHNGAFIIEKTQEAGIESSFVEISGESRICLNLIDQSDGSSTEVLEPGPEIDAERLNALKRSVRELSRRSALVIFSGSMPRGAPPGLYAELIGIAREEGASAFLDASGEALRLGIQAKPDFVKPNEEEAAALTGLAESDGSGRTTRSLEAIMGSGIRHAAVTLGAEGAIAGSGGRFYRIAIPPIKPVNTVGSGDAFVAGFAYGYVKGWPAAECFRYAAAAGSANASSPVTGDAQPAIMAELLRGVDIREWTRHEG